MDKSLSNITGVSSLNNLSYASSISGNKTASNTFERLSSMLPFSTSNDSKSIGGFSGTAINSLTTNIPLSSTVSDINYGLFGTESVSNIIEKTEVIPYPTTPASCRSSHTNSAWGFLSNGFA